MRDKIAEALKQNNAEYTKIPIEDQETTRVSFRVQDLETVDANIDKGGTIHCLIRNKGGDVVTFNGIDDLVAIVNLAHQYARMGTITEPIKLAWVEPVDSVTMVMLGI